jgi:hypothetical protein
MIFVREPVVVFLADVAPGVLVSLAEAHFGFIGLRILWRVLWRKRSQRRAPRFSVMLRVWREDKRKAKG